MDYFSIVQFHWAGTLDPNRRTTRQWMFDVILYRRWTKTVCFLDIPVLATTFDGNRGVGAPCLAVTIDLITVDDDPLDAGPRHI